MPAFTLPRPSKDGAVDADYMEKLLRRLEITRPLKALEEYQVVRPTTFSRDFNPNTATLADVASTLAIVLLDLQGD